MKDVCQRWLPLLLVAVAVALFPMAHQALAIPGMPVANPTDCYQSNCHTLLTSDVAGVGKAVQEALLQTLTTDGVGGLFERDLNSPVGHELPPDTGTWEYELKCVGCHTGIQGELVEGIYHSTHPIYSVINTNHVRCIDCHDPAVVRADNYHGLEGTNSDKNAWLRFGVPTNPINDLCDKCHSPILGLDPIFDDIGTGFGIFAEPVNRHGYQSGKYDDGTYSSCADFADVTAYDTGCHGAHTHAADDGLVGVGNYESANMDAFDFCGPCHPDQEFTSDANYAHRHDYDEAYVIGGTECDNCHSFVMSADHYQTAGYHTGNPTNFLINLETLATMPKNDAFCIQCHDGTYPGTFNGWQGGALGHGNGDAGIIDVDGDASNYGYNINGHGLDSGNFAAAAWKSPGATGNPNPVTALVALFSADVSCYACHDPHGKDDGSGNNYITLATVNNRAVIVDGTINDNTACTACHNAPTNIDGNGNPIPPISQFQGLDTGDYNASAHGDSGVGNLSCFGDADGTTRDGCHDPHGLGTGTTAYKAMMPNDEQDACTAADCHGTNAVGSTWNKSTGAGEFSLASHHPVTFDRTGDYNGDGTNDEVECTNCHNPHILTAANPMVNPEAINAAMTDQATTPDFSLETDFCLACHDGTWFEPVGSDYGIYGAIGEKNHWGTGVAPSEEAFSNVECDHCHDPHGSQNLRLVGVTYNGPTVTNPMDITNRSIYNINDAAWAGGPAGNYVIYNTITSLDPSLAGNNDGTTINDDGVCDRCHNVSRGDNNTHQGAEGTYCVTCHGHNAVRAFPMLLADACYLCHSETTAVNFKTKAQFGSLASGTLANGSYHNITYSADSGNDCYCCHLLNDVDDANDHKNGIVVLQVNAGTKYYSHSGDYKINDTTFGDYRDTAKSAAIAFCLECHKDGGPAGGNFDTYVAANTPAVSITTLGTNYQADGHGAGSLIGNGTAAPDLDCTTCHQYHGGALDPESGDPTSVPGSMTVIDVANEDMLERLTAGVTDYDYLHDNAVDKDKYCALTCHSSSTRIDRADYANGLTVIDHTWRKKDVGDSKTQADCPQTGSPWNDCDTHPTYATIPTPSTHYKSDPTLPLSGYDFADDYADDSTINWSTNSGDMVCTSCHDVHAYPNVSTWNETDKQMMKDSWRDATSGKLCSDATYCHQ